MKQEVRDFFPAFTDRFEGRVPFMYTDSLGLVTTGRGNLIDHGPRRKTVSDPVGWSNSDLAATLPWQVGARPATRAEIDAAFWTVKKAWPARQSVQCAILTSLRLSDAAVDDLTRRTLDAMWAESLRFFPDLEDWPAPAQLGLLSMAWAMGDAFEGGFPKFAAAAKAHDWATCALECQITQNAPLLRNAANKALFTRAAAGNSSLT